MPSVHRQASRQCPHPSRQYSAPPLASIPLCAPLRSQATQHQNPGRHESEAATRVLGWPRIVERPNQRFQPTVSRVTPLAIERKRRATRPAAEPHR